MKLDIRNNRDFGAGMMFFLIGVGAMLMARHYPFRIAQKIGPGYFPMVLSGVLILFGLFIMVRGLRRSEKMKGNWPIRALIMLPLSVVVYGVLMDRAGFVPALIALVFVSAASGREFGFKEVLFLAIGLTVMSVAIFIWAIGMPYPLFRNF